MSRWFVVGVALAVTLVSGACTPRQDGADSSRARVDTVPAVVAPITARADTAVTPVRAESARRSPAPPARRPSAPRPADGVADTGRVDAGPRRIMVGTLDVTDLGYDRGNPLAPVVIVEFSDFGCPYCADFALQTFPAIDSLYIATGKVLFKYVPFLAGTFRNSAEATRAMECVVEQRPEQFWLMMTRLYETQPGWKRRGSPDDLLRRAARSTGVDSARFADCYSDHRTDVRTKAGTDAAGSSGVWVTPSFVVNQRPVQGALPLGEFRKVIEAELRARRRQP